MTAGSESSDEGEGFVLAAAGEEAAAEAAAEAPSVRELLESLAELAERLEEQGKVVPEEQLLECMQILQVYAPK